MSRTPKLVAAALLLATAGWLAIGTQAQSGAPPATPPGSGAQGGKVWDYSSFEHKEHEAALASTGQSAISCDVCHKREVADTQLFYPGHDACIQCHVTQFTTTSFQICAICHTDVAKDGKALKPFPAERTEYGVRFDGAQGKSQHQVHMDVPMPDGSKVTCVVCHANRGANQAFPAHAECYICHTPGANSAAATPELSNCAVCHPGPTEPNSEMKRLIATRKNDALPYRFRHIDHTRALGTGCMDCHRVTQDIHVLSSGTKEHRAKPAFNCYECHRAGGRSKITETGCGACHGIMVFPPM